MKLYDIGAQYIKALNYLESIDDLDRDVIDDTLLPLKSSLEEKCLSVAAFIKNLEAESEAVKKAKMSMSRRQSALDNKAQKLREYLAFYMPQKVSNAQLSVFKSKPREKLIVDNIDLLPDFCVKVEKTPIKAKVAEFFDDLPPGAARKEPGKPGITIK